MDYDIIAIAIDSTGLKRFCRDEWHQEKHKMSAKRSWRKAHLAVKGNHIIESAVLTHKDVMDDQVVDAICAQIQRQSNILLQIKCMTRMPFTKHWKSTFQMQK
ncbi:transposase [Moritella sp.]|uniref:transposase n=1 Tax=Moritella sp. TaxID=78556 RepID=UPI0034586D9A